MTIPLEAIRQIEKPTPAQAESGNYRMAHVAIHGLQIAIENAKGSRRKPTWPPLAAHYGYIKRTLGRDGDHVDVFIGPNTDSELVVIVDQVNQFGKFDEHKVLIGFDRTQDAIDTYKKCYSPGWKVGPVTTMTIGQFKNWLKDGSQEKAVAKQVSRFSADAMALLIEQFAAVAPQPQRPAPTFAERFAAAWAESEVEQFAARKAKNSPGQMGLFGDGMGGDKPLRTAARQQKLDWITVHPNGGKGQAVLIDKKDGTIHGGMGGKFDGQKIDDVGKGDGKTARGEGKADENPVDAKPKKVAAKLKSKPTPESPSPGSTSTGPALGKVIGKGEFQHGRLLLDGKDVGRINFGIVDHGGKKIGRIDDVAIDNPARGNRMMSTIYPQVEKILKDQGATEIQLNTTEDAVGDKVWKPLGFSHAGGKATKTWTKPLGDSKPTVETMAKFLNQGKSHADFVNHIKDQWYSDKITEKEWNDLHDQMPKINDWADASKMSGKDVFASAPAKKGVIVGKVTGMKVQGGRIALEVTDHEGNKHTADPSFVDDLRAKIGHDANRGRVTSDYLNDPHVRNMLASIADEVSDGNNVSQVISKHFGEIPITKRMPIIKAIAEHREAKQKAKDTERSKPSPGRAAAMQNAMGRDDKGKGIHTPALKNEDAKAGDQLGMFGEATRAPKKQAEFIGTKGKQINLIDGLNAKPGQMSLIDEAGAPDDMVFKPTDRSRYSAAAIAAFIERHFAATEATIEQYRTAAHPSPGSKPKAKPKSDKPKIITGNQGDRGRFVTNDDGNVFFLETERTRDNKKRKREAERNPHKFVPVTDTEKAIVHQIGDHKEDVKYFTPFVDEAHAMISERLKSDTNAMQETLAQFGYTGNKASGFISSLHRRRDAAVIPQFDLMVDYAKKHYPQLLTARPGESTAASDDEAMLFDRLKAGFPKPPSKSDPEVIDMAYEMSGIERSGLPSTWADPEPEDAEELEEAPFSAGSNAVTERYEGSFAAVFAANYGAICGIPS